MALHHVLWLFFKVPVSGINIFNPSCISMCMALFCTCGCDYSVSYLLMTWSNKRDELTAHKQLKSILVTSSYIRLTMLFQGQSHGQGQSWQLTKSNALRSIDELVFCFMATGPPIPDVWLVKRHDREKVKVMAKVKNWKPHLRPSVQSMRSLFVSWQLDFFLIYSTSNYWLWKLKVKVMVKVKIDGHIWGLVFNQYVHF